MIQTHYDKGETKIEYSERYKPENEKSHGNGKNNGNFPRIIEKVSEKLSAKEL